MTLSEALKKLDLPVHKISCIFRTTCSISLPWFSNYKNALKRFAFNRRHPLHLTPTLAFFEIELIEKLVPLARLLLKSAQVKQ